MAERAARLRHAHGARDRFRERERYVWSVVHRRGTHDRYTRAPLTAEDLPEIVRRLVNRHLASMDHVEVLLFLFRDPAGAHGVEAIAAATRLERRVAERVLDDLVAAGLAVQTGETYTARGEPADREAVEALNLMYETRPVTLVRAIYARPTPVKSFADAFLFRKSDDR